MLFVLLGMPEVLIKRAIDTVLDFRGEERCNKNFLFSDAGPNFGAFPCVVLGKRPDAVAN